MKKIVGAVLAATMLAGTAMADIGFSYTSSNYFTTDGGGNLKYVNGARTDCLSVTMSNAAGGAVVDFDIEGGSLVKDEYYGWLNWGLPLGQLQVTAGVWNGRYVNRIRADAGDLKAADFEKYKPGVIGGATGGDSDNLTLGNIATVAAWTLTDILPGTLMAKFGLVKSTYNPDATASTTSTGSGDVVDGDASLAAGFVGEVAYQQNDLIRANFAVRNLVKNNFSFGAWVSPLMIDKLSLTVGGTIATVQNWNKADKLDGGMEWGVDLRARYKITDALSVTTMNNISGAYDGARNEDGDKVSKKMTLWNMVNATYAIADNLTAGLTLNSVCAGFDEDHKANCDGFDITVSPSLAIQATEKAAVTVAFRAAWTDVNLSAWDENLNVTVPVIFSFSY